MSAARVVVAGIGNPLRHDDGAGLETARRLAARLGGVANVGPCGEPLDLLGRWDRADLAVVVDAVCSGAPPGTVQTVQLDPALPTERAWAPTGSAAGRVAGLTSTHGIGVAGVLRLSRALGLAPRRVLLVGIEAGRLDPGAGLSPAVVAGVTRAVHTVLALLQEDGAGQEHWALPAGHTGPAGGARGASEPGEREGAPCA